MYKAFSIIAGGALSCLIVGPASATAVILTGDYLQVSVNEAGTFGQGGGTGSGGTRPAFVHDPSGTGTFDLDTDYIAPGTPHDGFSLISDQFGFTQNNNTGPFQFASTGLPTLLVGSAARGYANAAEWVGGLPGVLNISNSYFFNPGDERVLIETSITALIDLTNLAFARSVDPDSGGFNSINQRGNATFSINDFIGSESETNGRTLALVNVDNGGFENGTQINAFCCANVNPYTVLANAGADLGLNSVGDHSLNLAYFIGALGSGSTATFQYAYAAGEGLDDISVPPPITPIPEPSTWAMIIIGFGAIGGAMRARQRSGMRVTYA